MLKIFFEHSRTYVFSLTHLMDTVQIRELLTRRLMRQNPALCRYWRAYMQNWHTCLQDRKNCWAETMHNFLLSFLLQARKGDWQFIEYHSIERSPEPREWWSHFRKLQPNPFRTTFNMTFHLCLEKYANTFLPPSIFQNGKSRIQQ